MPRYAWSFLAIGALMASCFVPRLEVELTLADAGDSDGGTAGAGGGFVMVHCADLFPAAWPAKCAACIAQASCCAGVEASCGNDPLCVATAKCIADNLDPEGPQLCSQDSTSYYLYAKSALQCAEASQCAPKCSGARWECVDKWSSLRPPAGKQSVTLRLAQLVEKVQPEDPPPIAGAMTRLCVQQDPTCLPGTELETTPLGGATHVVDLPFTGSFEVEPAGHPPWRLFLPQLDDPIELPIELPNLARISNTVSSASKSYDKDNKAHALVRVTDCLQFPAHDVTVEVEGHMEATAIYFDDKLVSVLTKSTRDNGLALLVDIDAPDAAPFPVVVRARTKSAPRDVVAERAAYLQKGHFAYVLLEPNRM